MGRKVDWRTIGRTYLTYANVYSDESRQGVVVHKDVAYGINDRHRLDIYTAEKTAIGLQPVMVYVHGGGFVQGDKSRESNVGYYFARHGMLSISINYRLAPITSGRPAPKIWPLLCGGSRPMPKHTAGDGSRIVLMGHSAGAAHVATFAFDEAFRDNFGGQIRGAVLLSSGL